MKFSDVKNPRCKIVFAFLGIVARFSSHDFIPTLSSQCPMETRDAQTPAAVGCQGAESSNQGDAFPRCHVDSDFKTTAEWILLSAEGRGIVFP